MEDKIDLFRIKDARKAFRRRYASRTNAETIFNDCDGGRKGYLDAHDIHKQASKIGIGISLDEAQVLLQSAKEAKDDKNGLTSQEFANLIFSTDDALEVDLKQLKPLTEGAPVYKAESRAVNIDGDQVIAN